MPRIIQKMTFSRKALFMPLNLAICAAVVPDGWDVEIIDENVTDLPHVASGNGIDAVGIGAMTTQAKRAYELADAYRALGVSVILGGIHPSALPDEAIQHATIVCKGDAEGTLPRALADLSAGKPGRIYDWRDDPDAPMKTWVHWVLYCIPPDTTSLEEGIPGKETLPNGSRHGINDFRRHGYGGPCPPRGKPHRYFFKLYALDTELELKPGARKKDLLKAMEGHIIGKGELIGTYQRK